MMMRHVPRGGGPQTAQITNGYSNSVHRNIANTANTTPATTYYMYTVIRIITGCAISLFLISTIAMHFMVQDIMNDQVQSRGIVEHNIQKEEAAHDTTRRRKKLERKTHQKGHGDHRNKVAPAVDFIPDGEQDANNNNVINNDAFVTTDVWKKHPGIEQPSGKILSTLQEYIDLRETYDAILPDDAGAEARRLTYARTEARVRSYKPILLEDLDTTNGGGGMSYDPLNCPDEPPDGYPHTWNVMDVIGHWSPDDPTPHNEIHQGICVFQYATDIDKIFSYRRAEVPYVVRDDPQVLKTVERWGHADYLKEMLQNKKQMTEHSENNHFMYWKEPKRGNKKPHGWEPPTEMTSMGYLDWLKKADGPESDLLTDKEHWYYRLNSPPLHHQLSGGHKKGKINALRGDKEKKKKGNDFVLLYDELAFFQPHHNLYLVNPEDERGINCRFGMKGVIAGKLACRF